MAKITIEIIDNTNTIEKLKKGWEDAYSLSQFIDCRCDFDEDDVTVKISSD